jgi:phage baseplate assembly protein W
MAITEGHYTVGIPGSGADYADFETAVYDMADLTGDLTLEQIADTREGGSQYFSGALNGYTLKFTTNARHNGRLGEGYRCLASLDFGIRLAPTGTGSIEIEYLNFVSGAPAYRMLWVDTNNDSISVSIHDIILDYRGKGAAEANYGMYIYSQTGGSSYEVYNVLLHHWWPSTISYAGWFSDIRDLGGMKVENVTVIMHPSATAGRCFFIYESSGAFNPTTLRNCVAMDSVDECYYTALAGNLAEAYNCMATDTTATAAGGNGWNATSGCINSITPSSEFESLDPDDSNFLWPKSTGQAQNQGTTPVISANDYSMLTTIPRPARASTYSIGLFDYPGTPSITVQPSDQSVNEGDNATFSITAENVQSYQWYRNDIAISGATSSTYTQYDVGGTEHLDEYKCDAISESATTTSGIAKMLVNSWPPGTGAAAPNPPTISEPSLVDRTLTFVATGTADTFKALLYDADSNLVTSDQRDGAGTLIIVIPSFNEEYNLVVQAGNYGSPPSWSLPGVVATVYLRETSTGTTLSGSTFERKISQAAIDAGPLGVGVAYPFRISDDKGGVNASYGLDHVREGMRQIIGTPINERFMRREFGTNVRRSLQHTIPVAETEIGTELVSALAKWERRISIEKLALSSAPNKGVTEAKIDFSAKRTYEKGNLVYPFSARETDGGG